MNTGSGILTTTLERRLRVCEVQNGRSMKQEARDAGTVVLLPTDRYRDRLPPSSTPQLGRTWSDACGGRHFEPSDGSVRFKILR